MRRRAPSLPRGNEKSSCFLKKQLNTTVEPKRLIILYYLFYITFMQIIKLQQREAPALSLVVREIIINTPYYSRQARGAESKKYTTTAIKQKLRDKNSLLVVAKQNGRLVGFCHGSVDVGTCWIHWVGVAKGHRQKGVAMRLLKSLEKKLRKAKVHKIWCDSRINNKESIPLLKKFGLRRIAFLKKHWYGHDFYLWQKFI